MDEAAFKKLVSGETRGVGATLARAGLRGLSVGYGAAVRARNRAFDLGLKSVHRAPVPVVSVGNLTTGGTGKTPLVAWLANWFRERGRRIVVLSRGYRALPGGANDEKLVLDRLCPGVPHLQNPDRAASARRAREEFGAEVLILDDGFQHRRLARDLDIVLVDALNPWGYGHLLPRGLLREPLAALRRAHVVVLTRADQCEPAAKEAILSRIRRTGTVAEVIEAAYPPVALVNAAGEAASLSLLSRPRTVAFCGIGNPGAFERTIAEQGAAPESLLPFPDHHHYTASDLERLAVEARRLRAAVLVTTEKDLVKINRAEVGGCPLWAVRIGAVITSGREALERRLLGLCGAGF